MGTSSHTIYYLTLDGQTYDISDSSYRHALKTQKDKLYSIFSKYSYFSSKVTRKQLDVMSLEGIILLYVKLRKENENQ